MPIPHIARNIVTNHSHMHMSPFQTSRSLQYLNSLPNHNSLCTSTAFRSEHQSPEMAENDPDIDIMEKSSHFWPLDKTL